MLGSGAGDDLLDVQLLTQPCIEFRDTKVNFGTELLKRVYPLQELSTELILSLLGQLQGARNGKVEGFGHVQS